MKKFALLMILVCLALAACSAPPAVSTPLGKFEYTQETMAGIEDDQGNSLTAAAGNTLLVVYMTPDKDSSINEDQAYTYFYNGTQASVAGQTYDLKCIALEKSGGRLRYGLVFEITDNGYDQKQPDVSLSLPESAPAVSAEPSAAADPSAAVSPAEIPTTEPDASPATSTATDS
jgi:hypothetical protein